MDGAALKNQNPAKACIEGEGPSNNQSTLLQSSFKVVLLCCEPQHTGGYVSRGCLRCTMPICDACVIKDAFGKRESTYHNRRRYVCAECWYREAHLTIQPIGLQSKTLSTYAKLAESQEFCQCSVHDGWLCSRCKTEQNSNMAASLEQCAITGCPIQPLSDRLGGRMCLWCNFPMPGRMSPGEARRDYDSLHLPARAYSTCEPLTPETPEVPAISWFHIRRRSDSVFQGREDSQINFDTQTQPAPKPSSLLRADSATDLPTRGRKGKDSFKREAGLLPRFNFMRPSYQRRGDRDGQGLRSMMVKWRSSSTSLLIRRPTCDVEMQSERPSIVLYEGP